MALAVAGDLGPRLLERPGEVCPWSPCCARSTQEAGRVGEDILGPAASARPPRIPSPRGGGGGGDVRIQIRTMDDWGRDRPQKTGAIMEPINACLENQQKMRGFLPKIDSESAE